MVTKSIIFGRVVNRMLHYFMSMICWLLSRIIGVILCKEVTEQF